MFVKFDARACALRDLLAHSRQLSSRKSKTKENPFCSSSSLEKDVIGASGEVAFFMAIPQATPFWSTEPKSKKSGSDKGDFVLPQGQTLDLKTTKLPNGRLIVPADSSYVDLFALAIYQDDFLGELGVNLIGYVTAEMVQKKKPQMLNGRRVKIFGQSELIPFKKRQ